MKLLEIRGVRKSYGAVKALQGVDLTVRPGGIFGLVGPNGAGKTTLFSVLCGFLRADAGEVRVAGHPVTPSSPPPKGAVSILPQDAGFVSHLPVGRQLAYYARLQGMAPAQARDAAAHALQRVGLADVARRKPKTLSHGMHKRVGIAQAFLGDPSLVVLDEPTAGLDPHAARDIRALLRTIGSNRTVVVSSHNLSEVEDLCHEVAILHDGRVVRQDTLTTLVGAAGQIAFRLTASPDDALLRDLEALDFLEDVAWDADDERLRLRFDPRDRAVGQAARDLVGFLVDRDVPFVEMQLGKSLEERFIEETGRGA
ncbi:MAG: ABC transporter ATP-binding protein [Myxococcota bacterium]